MVLSTHTWVLAIYLLFLPATFCCNNHELDMKDIKPCRKGDGKMAAVRNINVTFSLSSACKLGIKGCFEVRRKLVDTKLDYFIKKGTWSKNGTMNFCETIRRPEVQKTTQEFKMPQECPIKSKVYCTGGKTDVSTMSPHMHLLKGDTQVYLNFVQEDPPETCILINIAVKEKKKKRA